MCVPLVFLLLPCILSVLVTAQPPVIEKPGIQGVPAYVEPGTNVTAFVKVSDPLKRVLSFYWTLTDPGGDVIQASIEATKVPYFIIQDTSTLPPRYGAYVLEVAVTAPRPSDIPGLESDAADVTTASFYFGLVNMPPSKPVILGINTAGDGTNGDRIVEVDGCGGALALFAAKGEGNLLEPPTDPEQAGPLWYTWEVFTTSGKIVMTSPTSYNHILIVHTGKGPAGTTLPPGNYTARVTVYDSTGPGNTAASVTAVSEPFSIAICSDGYLPFSQSVYAIFARVLEGIGAGELVDPFLGSIGQIAGPPVESGDGGSYGSGSYVGSYGGDALHTEDGHPKEALHLLSNKGHLVSPPGSYGDGYGGYGGYDGAGAYAGAPFDPVAFSAILEALLQGGVPLLGAPFGVHLDKFSAAALSALQQSGPPEIPGYFTEIGGLGSSSTESGTVIGKQAEGAGDTTAVESAGVPGGAATGLSATSNESASLPGGANVNIPETSNETGPSWLYMGRRLLRWARR